MIGFASGLVAAVHWKSLVIVIIAGLAALGCPLESDLAPAPAPVGEHWLRLAHLSDVHVTDEESPARAVRGDGFISSAWRPQEAYATQVLDATLDVINQRHWGKLESAWPIDLVLVTGDVTDGALHNELRWFIDTMDGQEIVPDSGALDGGLRETVPEDNPKLAFRAVGLADDIPWYTVFGNHEGLAVGTFGIDRGAADPRDWTSPLFPPVAFVLGLHALEPPTDAWSPVSAQSPAIITGAPLPMDVDTLQLRAEQLEAGAVVSDENRQFSSRARFIEEHFNTTSTPLGHGFTASNRASGRARYSVRPKPDAPVRIVVMDTVAPEPTPLGFPVEYGVMTREQFENFVKPEIEAARTADEFVIVASHHPSTDFGRPYPALTVGDLEFRSYLASRPNVIAHVCGHTHRHHVTLVPGAYPYYEIETGSLIDYPQEGRILDVYYVPETGDVRLESRIFSHLEAPTRLSAESFRRATIDALTGKSIVERRDAEEFKALFPDPAAKLGQSYTLPSPEEWSPTRSLEERYGRKADREFSVVLHR
ncbi:MAG: metallophosphoesterase [Candidatus Hydrogenedentes bacterium]|nr:metallophosphoesterase [Candidatus Hydrogenedentota bacterium]